MKCIGEDMLDDDTNGLNEGLVRSSAGHGSDDVLSNFREHEDSKGGKIVPGVAGELAYQAPRRHSHISGYFQRWPYGPK